MTADRKLRSIKEILRNETYGIDSGLYQGLERDLNKLSADTADTLSNLNLIIQLKIAEIVKNEPASVER